VGWNLALSTIAPIFFSLDDIGCLTCLAQKPGVCLLFLYNETDKCSLKKIVDSLIKTGIIFFITYGKFSEELHDTIDEIIELSEIDLTYVVAVSMQNESFDEVIWFFLNSAYLEKNESRYIVIFDTNGQDIKSDLVKNILELSTEFKPNRDGQDLYVR
jgi:hypothetical protein